MFAQRLLRQRLSPAVVFLAMLITTVIAAGCSYDGSLGEVACDSEDDCPEEARCTGGYCVFDDDNGGGTFNVSEGCDGDKQVCGDECVDTQRDSAHCGDCFESCEDGQYCVDGLCSSDCDETDPQQAVCDGNCVNPETDIDHCGDCFESCETYDGAEVECDGGNCFYDCVDPGDDVELCRDEGQCANLAIDTDHCGVCGRQCGDVDGVDEVHCVSGQCSYDCGSGYSYCSDIAPEDDIGTGSCVDTTDALDHCGSCGNECPTDGPDATTPTCEQGQCGFECNADDDTLCDLGDQHQCIDTTSSVDHCGGCHESCPTDPKGTAECIDAQCTLDCQDELDVCDETCVDTATDNNHCGSCGNQCGDDETCNSSTCIELPSCDPQGDPFGGGGGTPDDPYLICTPAQLQRIDQDTDNLDGHFQLVDDLDLDGIDFSPIAPGQPDGVGGIVDTFDGHFDGYGHTITNLQIDTTAVRAGLFGGIGTGGIVEDFVLVDVDVTGGDWVGAVAGAVGGMIRDVSVEELDAVNVIEGDDLVGAITGFNQGTVQNSEATADVIGEREVGTIAGRSNGGINNVTAHGSILATDRRAGGVVGRQTGGTIDNSSTWATVESQGNTAGGLVGWIDGAGATVESSTANGDVEGNFFVGGITGSNSGFIDASQAHGDVDGSNNVGGLAGSNDGVIDDAQAYGDVDGGENVGGLVGENDGDIIASHSAGHVVGVDNVGGLVGMQASWNDQDGSVVDSSSTSDVDATGSRIGGLVGHTWGDVTRSYASGDVNADADIDTTTSSSVGGLVGDLRGTAGVTDCYARGQVNGGDGVGGLVGDLRGQWPVMGEVETSYSTGAVSATSNQGGLVGNNHGGDVTDSYWNTDSSGLSDSDGGSPLDADQFGDPANFDGFNFNSIWEMSDDPDDERPVLQWESN